MVYFLECLGLLITIAVTVNVCFYLIRIYMMMHFEVVSHIHIYALVKSYVDICKWESFGSRTPCRSKRWNTSCSKRCLVVRTYVLKMNALTILKAVRATTLLWYHMHSSGVLSGVVECCMSRCCRS